MRQQREHVTTQPVNSHSNPAKRHINGEPNWTKLGTQDTQSIALYHEWKVEA